MTISKNLVIQNIFIDGPKLWVWVPDDGIADIHEANSEILHQRGLHWKIKILRLQLKLFYPQNGFLSAVPYLGMWISSLFLSMMADWFISTNRLSITATRKILNTIGQFGPAICLAVVSYTGCNRVLTVFLLTIGISMNGGIYSGFKVIYLL